MKLYVVHEDWANDDNAGWAIYGVYDSLDKAKKALTEAKTLAENDGLTFNTVSQDTETEYSTYNYGWYDSAHYQVAITEKELNK